LLHLLGIGTGSSKFAADDPLLPDELTADPMSDVSGSGQEPARHTI
jgi:hypothetical protein